MNETTAWIFSIFILVMILAWLWQFLQLMLLEDSMFPGRHDKLIWGAVFVFIWPLAPIAFMVWKRLFLALREVERERP